MVTSPLAFVVRTRTGAILGNVLFAGCAALWRRPTTSVGASSSFSFLVPTTRSSLGRRDAHHRRTLRPRDVARASADADADTSSSSILHNASPFVAHVLVPEDGATVRAAVASAVAEARGVDGVVDDDASAFATDVLPDPRRAPLDRPSTPTELLALGAVWCLPASAPRDPAAGARPARLTLADADRVLDPGDLLRVHHVPRRFPATREVDWGLSVDEVDADGRPGVVVAVDDDAGYLVVDKPGGVPVHATVDNALENVSGEIARTRLRTRGPDERPRDENADDARHRQRKPDPLVYVTTPMRLDQNTSGLLVVSTKKTFAAYFARLLAAKTDSHLRGDDNDDNDDNDDDDLRVRKRYRCLVCVSDPFRENLERLRSYADSDAVLTHFLEPSVRAPKTFVAAPPSDAATAWPECRSRVVAVPRSVPVRGGGPEEALRRGLWGASSSSPDDVVGAAEVDVELLTGRTHQIRGQLSAEGFPIVGDVLYGGAAPPSSDEDRVGYSDSERLALRCRELSFPAPPRDDDDDHDDDAGPPRRRRTFRADRAWWTEHLDAYEEARARSADAATTSSADGAFVASDETESDDRREKKKKKEEEEESVSLLPPRVDLEPGRHKYVVVEAEPRFRDDPSPSVVVETYVRSASPESCGGPYHADVAASLLAELRASKRYREVTVVGGGRIDHCDEIPHAHVFGFSYGFGRGDHAAVAKLIETETEGRVSASYSDDPNLY